jgi:hypothetical protein
MLKKNFTLMLMALFVLASCKASPDKKDTDKEEEVELASIIKDANLLAALVKKKKKKTLLSQVTKINVHNFDSSTPANKKVKDASGLEHFPNLTYLNLINNLLTAVDITNNSKLFSFRADTGVDVTHGLGAGQDKPSSWVPYDIYANKPNYIPPFN